MYSAGSTYPGGGVAGLSGTPTSRPSPQTSAGYRRVQHSPTVDPRQQQAMEFQQAQLEYQLRQMQLKNLEMQSALLAQAVAAQQRQQMPPSFAYEEDDTLRRDALQTLDRAQRHRHASANDMYATPLQHRPRAHRAGPRLSFGGNDGASLAEHALARHSRHTSVDSSVSPAFRQQHHVSSVPPSSGTETPAQPTVVLSKPGDAFPTTSPPPATDATAAAERRARKHAKTASGSSSTSSSISEDGSESRSFESSATSIGSPLMAAGAAVNKLNPSASTFQPAFGIAPPIIFAPTPAVRVSPRFTVQAESTPAVAVRQPRGPARDEEFEAKNFASRIRRRAIVSIRNGRTSFVGVMGEIEKPRGGSGVLVAGSALVDD